MDARVVDGGGGHGHAVVIGSSIAGLTAARALANFMDHVTVIERDRLPRGPGRRRGVPQARHTHSLMTAAHQGLERLFPGIGQDLARAGAVHVRLPEDVLLLGPAGWLPRFDSGLSMLSAGRDLLDSAIRDRLRADPRVSFLPEHEVVALQPGPQDTVTGVWARGRDRKAPDGWTPRRLIPAEFVVDASGRGSRAPKWLAELGYEPPAESVADARTAYATTLYAPPVGHVADWKSLMLMASAGDPRQGMLHPVEGGRWSVSLSTGDGTPPPTDHEELLRAAGALRSPLLRDLIETATPLGPVYSCSRTESRWRHYDRLRRWPDQFLVVGDALAALDPAHGHGMTLAVQCALVLDDMLAAHGTAIGISHRLRRALAHRIAPAWRLSTRTPHPADPGQDPPAGLRARLGRRYASRIAAAATTDRHAATLLLHLHQCFETPAAALRTHALRAALRPRRDPAPATPPSLTHGLHARRRRPLAPTPPAIGVSAGSAGPRPGGSSAHWPAAAPAGERKRP
ncbi:FAD-dependent oxidoreductase [Streptomyces rishiriensis]|uniref:2-polyprenyl-6-methoxyphenol hydroxylase-like FAD-dependent oxidoreductase n=1 Tax=Streptomyces rishiriensis TaxID=68264 RepID=A0ABU0P3B3_STRRH|nr:FAD-dependent monooxygenase [Streptomyces rishiriensis]MDQ0585859.1 2-polyprenyl-6-methoxyphenol hydroxylase-like FAD-dependent oxidoreductase [Streptomyces rishiriensis]